MPMLDTLRDDRFRYTFVLAGLLLLLLIDPLAEQYLGSLASLVVNLALMLPLVLGIWGLRGTRRWYRAGQWLVGTTIVLQAINLVGVDGALDAYVIALVAVFTLGTSLFALHDVLFGGPIDYNRLLGAICVYLLIGLAWGLGYHLLDLVTEASAFSNIETHRGGDVGVYIYYSFVTLTTLGYGDIAPLTPMAKTLAYLEAVCGQLYLTILVAALVGMLLSRRVTEAESR